MTPDPLPSDMSMADYAYWIAAKRVEHEAGRKLTPGEMVAAIDAAGGHHELPERGKASGIAARER